MCVCVCVGMCNASVSTLQIFWKCDTNAHACMYVCMYVNTMGIDSRIVVYSPRMKQGRVYKRPEICDTLIHTYARTCIHLSCV